MSDYRQVPYSAREEARIEAEHAAHEYAIEREEANIMQSAEFAIPVIYDAMGLVYGPESRESSDFPFYLAVAGLYVAAWRKKRGTESPEELALIKSLEKSLANVVEQNMRDSE